VQLVAVVVVLSISLAAAVTTVAVAVVVAHRARVVWARTLAAAPVRPVPILDQAAAQATALLVLVVRPLLAAMVERERRPALAARRFAMLAAVVEGLPAAALLAQRRVVAGRQAQQAQIIKALPARQIRAAVRAVTVARAAEAGQLKVVRLAAAALASCLIHEPWINSPQECRCSTRETIGAVLSNWNAAIRRRAIPLFNACGDTALNSGAVIPGH
jgi:hypothetical protein